MNYTCENCDEDFDLDDMHMIDPVQTCVNCAEADAAYWYDQYRASGHQPEVSGGYDLDDPKHPEWAERKFELVGR